MVEIGGGRVIVKHSLKNINASDEIKLALWQGCFASPNESCLMRPKHIGYNWLGQLVCKFDVEAMRKKMSPYFTSILLLD